MRGDMPKRRNVLLATGLWVSCACSTFAQAPSGRFPPAPAAGREGPRVVSMADAPAPWLTGVAENWMGRLPDSTPLGGLSIPGTHDSGARFGGFLCQTQSWTLANMLGAGVRYLDIRNRRSGEVFAIHHGPCFQKITFGEVLDAVNGFLAAHPSEALVMRVKEEHTPAPGSLDFRHIWDAYMAKGGSRFAGASDHVPALGALRGKVFVLRDADVGAYGMAFTDAKVKLQDAWNVYPATEEFPYGPDSVSTPQKLRLVSAHLAAASDDNPAGANLYLNHVSGATGVSPAEFARQANRHVHDELAGAREKRSLGIVIMDFPGEHLIHEILKTNFAPE